MIFKLFQRFASNKLNGKHLTVFSSKSYDEKYFKIVNQTLPKDKQFKFDFLETELNPRMASLIPQNSHTVICFVNDQLDANSIQALKTAGVDLIALRCAGFNNVDLDEAQKQGITVVRVPAYSPHAVAEHTMAILMTLNRKIHKAYNRTRQNNFSLEGLLGFDLYQKTIGIVGFGKIGQTFAKICNGYGLKILVNDDIIKNPKELEDKFHVKFVDKDTLYK